MLQYLITCKEVHELTRKMSIHIENDKMDAFIREAENLDVKPVIGDGLFIALHKDYERFTALLNGGVYENEDGELKSFTGLKTALSYFVYARLVRNNDGQVTRMGFVNKDNDHSTRASELERERIYNDAVAIARRYMHECMDFIRQDNECTSCCGTKPQTGRYKVLGD